MDEISSTLFDRLVEKTFEDMDPHERLAFVEKLFLELPPEAQQAFLLKLALQTAGLETGIDLDFGAREGERVIVKTVRMGPESFGPWQMCCLAMNDFVEQPDAAQLEPEKMARMFTGMADETRLKIVKLLSERERSVDDLVQALGIAQSTTSHHLRVLKDAGLIAGDKRGRNIFYSLVHPLEEDIPT